MLPQQQSRLNRFLHSFRMRINSNNNKRLEDSKDSNNSNNRMVNLCISHRVTLNKGNKRERRVVSDLRICQMKGKELFHISRRLGQLFFERYDARRVKLDIKRWKKWGKERIELD